MSSINEAIVTLAEAVKLLNYQDEMQIVEEITTGICYLYCRQGDDMEKAYPETFNKLKALFGEEVMLVTILDAGTMTPMPRDTRMRAEQLMRQVGVVMRQYLDSISVISGERDVIRSIHASLEALHRISTSIMLDTAPESEDLLPTWCQLQIALFDSPDWRP